MSTCPGTGGASAGIPIDDAPPERVIEQLQRLADRTVRSRRRGGHLIARIESTDGSWCWETAATGAGTLAPPPLRTPRPRRAAREGSLQRHQLPTVGSH